MKKSLIALAALAAFGTASAQSTVTIGGTYNFGFQKVDSGATSADFFDSKVNFSGTEDLGGGLKASFSTEMQLGGRSSKDATTATATQDKTYLAGRVWARNATVSLSGGFGTVTGGRVENTNATESAILSGQSLSEGFDRASLTGSKANYNTVSYTSPAFNGLTVTAAQSKAIDANFAPATASQVTNATTGVTVITQITTNSETTINSIGANYANGPLATGFVYKMVDVANATKGNKTEIFATYDLGVAKLGLGYGKNSGDAYAGQKAGVLVSGAVPIGALTLGADYYTRAAGGATTTTGVALGGTAIDGKAYALVANYALSKRTNLKATVGKLTGTALIGEQQYRVGMYHTF